jgi:hypothetical protein
MVTPEELAEAACDDQHGNRFRAAQLQNVAQPAFGLRSRCLIGQIYRLGPNRLESARDQVEKRLGLDRT